MDDCDRWAEEAAIFDETEGDVITAAFGVEDDEDDVSFMGVFLGLGEEETDEGTFTTFEIFLRVKAGSGVVGSTALNVSGCVFDDVTVVIVLGAETEETSSTLGLS